jgi:hypothetical protein
MKNQWQVRRVERFFVRSKCRIAVCVVDGDKRIGPASLEFLKKAILHPKLRDQHHQVFFDKGLFSSEGKAKRTAAELMPWTLEQFTLNCSAAQLCIAWNRIFPALSR